MRQFRLYRLGSDAEFTFAKKSLSDLKLVPAEEIIRGTKQQWISSFIGLDTHTLHGEGAIHTTAELRPPPCRDIWVHLAYIAQGVAAVERKLNTALARPGVFMYAKPVIGVEYLGGHIHVSGFVNEPSTRSALDLNVSLSAESMPVNKQGQGVLSGPSGPLKSAIPFVEEALAGRATTPELFRRLLDYLVLPFEYWVQPWHLRRGRHQKYNNLEDINHYFIRWGNSPPPVQHVLYRRNWAYIHLEYRTPSTWLVHPWLAYAYFALVKLSLLNWDWLWETLPATKPMRLLLGTSDAPGAERCFRSRLAAMREAASYKESGDLADLDRAVAACSAQAARWFASEEVNYSAWNRLVVRVAN